MCPLHGDGDDELVAGAKVEAVEHWRLEACRPALDSGAVVGGESCRPQAGRRAGRAVENVQPGPRGNRSASLHRAEPQQLIRGMSGGAVSPDDTCLGAVRGGIEENAHPFAPQLQQALAVSPQAADFTRPISRPVRACAGVRACPRPPLRSRRSSPSRRQVGPGDGRNTACRVPWPAELENALDDRRRGLEAGTLDFAHRPQGGQRVERLSLRHERLPQDRAAPCGR